MEDGVDDGRGYADHGHLAESLDAEGVQPRIGYVDEVDVDVGHIGVDGHDVLGQVGVEEAAVAGVSLAALAQACPDAPDDSAAHLARRGHRAGDPPAVGDADHAGDADPAGGEFDAYLDEVGDEAECREGGVLGTGGSRSSRPAARARG